MSELDSLVTGKVRSSTIKTFEDIDFDALLRGEIIDQMFDPWRITERELRYYIGLHVKRTGNKRPLITFSRRNRSHVNNHVYCNPKEKFSRDEQAKRDERYVILKTGIYEYYVENGERMSLPEVRKRISSWIKRNCHVDVKSSYNDMTHIMTFFDPLFDPDALEKRHREYEAEILRIEADERPEW